jgi:peptidoglycan/LPS O-acetylase OafA/YrhL
MTSYGTRFSTVSAPSSNGEQTNFHRDLPNKVEALDGLRGVAILVVVCSHLRSIVSDDPNFYELTPWNIVNQLVSRGFLGVDLFFVLSGFLISSLLLKIDFRGSKHPLRTFYFHRFLRLFPALFALLIASFIVSYFEKYPLSDQWATTWPALLFVSNWNFQWNFFNFQVDLVHLWSLAVEEQFYILWPFILMSLRLCRIPRWLYFFVLSGAITWVCIHRIGLWDSGKSYIFLYSQTDTRIDSILVGCLFAFIYRYINFSATKVKWMGFIACVILLPFSYLFADYSEPNLFKGGFTFIAILIGIFILACTTTQSIATKILRHKALTNLGRMSYGLYLWHMLIFRLSERHLNIGSNSFRILATTCFTLLTAQFSWRYIEQPFINLKNRRFQEFP